MHLAAYFLGRKTIATEVVQVRNARVIDTLFRRMSFFCNVIVKTVLRSRSRNRISSRSESTVLAGVGLGAGNHVIVPAEIYENYAYYDFVPESQTFLSIDNNFRQASIIRPPQN